MRKEGRGKRKKRGKKDRGRKEVKWGKEDRGERRRSGRSNNGKRFSLIHVFS